MYFKSITDNNFNYRLKEAPHFQPEGFNRIKAFTFDGLDYDEKKTKVFAYIGYPEGQGPFPAVVLVHGGNGHAYPHWIKIWNDAGFAAIAMDVTGFFPAEDGDERKWNLSLQEMHKKKWLHQLPKSLEEPGYTTAPDNDRLKTSALEPDMQWMYHAVGETLIAGSILRDDPKVIKEKIGICGISWGGVITTIAIGMDNRFSYAIPIYGAGYLKENMGGIGDFFKDDMVNTAWRAEGSFKNVNIPVLWQGWNNDTAFSVNTFSKSYSDTLKNNEKTLLSIVDNMGHGHVSAWTRTEAVYFAKAVCNSSRDLPTLSEDGEIKYDRMERLSARLFYTETEYEYKIYSENGGDEQLKMNGEWKIADARIEKGIPTAVIPETARAYYYELELKTDDGSFIFSTQLKKA